MIPRGGYALKQEQDTPLTRIKLRYAQPSSCRIYTLLSSGSFAILSLRHVDSYLKGVQRMPGY